jgi:hypothetical protein
MRIAPVGIFYYDDADKLREIAYTSVVKARTEMELQCVSHLSAFFIMMMPISCEK